MACVFALVLALNGWIHAPGGAWEPSVEQVHEVQQRLRPFVEERAAAWRKELPAWGRYTIQYQGQMRDGRKVILINAMCDKPPAQVGDEIIYTLDGGPCFFRGDWIPESGEFSDFSFNGEA